MDRAIAVHAEQLNKVFSVRGKDPMTALASLTMDVRAGELTALIGPDGAGKTTLMRLICGLMAPTAGTLTVLGKDCVSDAEEIQSRLSYMPQKFGLYEDLTVAENMNLYADLHGVPKDVRKSRFEELLHMTGLSPFTKRFAGNLSGGMKQKLGLACTLVRSPDLLLLDEPTVGVDPLSRRELWEILKTLVKKDHLTVLVSTAYMNEAEMCSQVFVLNKGNLLAKGTPDELRHMADGRCRRVWPAAGMPTRVLQAHLLDDADHVTDAVPQGGAVRFIVKEPSVMVPYLKRIGLAAEDVSPRLEDSFMILLSAAGGNRLRSPAKIDDSVLDKGQAQTGETAIQVKNLVKKFGDFTAVANTSFHVDKGEVFGLLGPNGAGKTTTFKMLCGLLPETSGSLSVAGVDLKKARTMARANIGYVAQKFSLYAHMTVRENLEFYGGVYGIPKSRLSGRVKEIMEEFHLADRADEMAGDLPGGYKQRLSMAAALIHEPKILFLDEPTSGIDPLARRMFWRQITDLSARGVTIIITTHFMEEAEYCDRFMIQDSGKLLAIGSPSAIRKKLSQPEADMDQIFIEIVERSRRETNWKPLEANENTDGVSATGNAEHI